MNNTLKTPFQEMEMKEFKLPTSQAEDIRIPLISQSDNPIYKPVPSIHHIYIYISDTF